MLTVTKLSSTKEEDEVLLADTVAFLYASAPLAMISKASACLRRRKREDKTLETYLHRSVSMTFDYFFSYLQLI
jgi:hypothetical protein